MEHGILSVVKLSIYVRYLAGVTSFTINLNGASELLIRVRVPFIMGFNGNTVLRFGRHSSGNYAVLKIRLLTFQALIFLRQLPGVNYISGSCLIFSLNQFILIRGPRVNSCAYVRRLIEQRLSGNLSPVIIRGVFTSVTLTATNVTTRRQQTIICFCSGAFILIRIPYIVLRRRRLPITCHERR